MVILEINHYVAVGSSLPHLAATIRIALNVGLEIPSVVGNVHRVCAAAGREHAKTVSAIGHVIDKVVEHVNKPPFCGPISKLTPSSEWR